MSAFSDLDASSNTTALLAYLDGTDRSLSAMKTYIAATLGRRAHGHAVLDLGCGVGHDLTRLAKSGVIPVGVDLSAKALAKAQVLGFALVRADGAHLPFVSNAFAACRIERLLQHVVDPGAVLDEVARVLRQEGVVTIFEPDWTTFRVDSAVVANGTLPARFVAARHPVIGADVASMLQARGFIVEDIVTETSFGHRLDSLPLDAVAVIDRGVAAGTVEPRLRDQWLEEQRDRENAGTFRASWSKILTVARLASG